MMRKVELIESASQEITLSHEQAAALYGLGRKLYQQNPLTAEADKSMVECSMSSKGKWSVSVQNAAGVIAIPGLQIVVRPKIPLSHLVYLFARAKILPRFIDTSTIVAEDVSFAELIVAWFIESALSIIRCEPLLDYSEVDDWLPVARGSIHQIRSYREIMSGRLRFFCLHENYSLNNPANRLIRAAIEASLPMLPRNTILRKKALIVLSFLETAGVLVSTDLNYETDRRFAHYRDPIILAKAILSNSGRSIEHGVSLGWSFLIRTPKAIETGIREVLRSGLSDTCKVYARTGSVGNGYKVDPDLWFDPMAAVADIKYKLTPKVWARPDLYQCVAFAAALNSKRAGILSFHEQIHSVPKPVLFGSIAVEPLTWPMRTVDPKEAARELCDKTAAWLSNISGAGKATLVLYDGDEINAAA